MQSKRLADARRRCRRDRELCPSAVRSCRTNTAPTADDRPARPRTPTDRARPSAPPSCTAPCNWAACPPRYGTTMVALSVGICSRRVWIRSRTSNAFPPYRYSSTARNTDGSNCANRSRTARVPKSGEHDDQIAPRLATARNAANVSTQFGISATTRSPSSYAEPPQARTHPCRPGPAVRHG